MPHTSASHASLARRLCIPVWQSVREDIFTLIFSVLTDSMSFLIVKLEIKSQRKIVRL